MRGLELIRDAMHLKEVERIPWVPFVGAHAGALMNLTATEYLRSAEHIVTGVSKAIEEYDPDGIPVAFDLQIEAEALGCKLNWADDNPPAVISHPLMDGVQLADLRVPGPEDGRIPLVMKAARILREKHPDIALYGLITGPFTLALHLMGTDVFMRMMEDPDHVHAVMRFATDVGLFMSKEYIDAGCDVIAMVDPMTSQIDPGSFEMFVTPYAVEIFDFIREAGALGSFFVCGNAQQNIEVMCKCRPHNVSIDENIPLDFVRDVALRHDVSFGGNIKLTVVLLMGDEEDSRRDALECMDIGGKKGFILAPGCDLAMATPPANLKAVTELVRDEVMQSELRAAEAKVSAVEKLDLSAHWIDDKVVIDVVTLDSSSCAPCQYMMDAVTRAAEPYGDRVVCKEYRIKEKEGVQMMVTLGVMKIPTIVIDGKVEFSSQIPPVHEIRNRIGEYLDAKGS
ncbi:MAG: thioredoxin family protein [Bacteroidales bacterium]|nr:thioredoxin family protein [Bacteroidales bacterium]